MPTVRNTFFTDRLTQVDTWRQEFEKKLSDPEHHDSTSTIQRFIRDCRLLMTEMSKARDPGLTDLVDLNTRYQFLEASRRRIINEVPNTQTD